MIQMVLLVQNISSGSKGSNGLDGSNGSSGLMVLMVPLVQCGSNGYGDPLSSNGSSGFDNSVVLFYLLVYYSTNHSQFKWSMCVTCVSHACDTCGVSHTRMGFLDSTRVYMQTQYLYTHVHAHAVFIHACLFTRVHVCMGNVAS